MPMSTTLVCMRHGEPEARSRGRVYGKLDVGLSTTGRAQVAATVPWLRRFAFTAIYASPRVRASESAGIIGDALGISVGVDPAFAEIDFGAFEGRTYQEIEREHPQLYAQWMTAPTTVRFPDGESFDDVQSRVLDGVGRIRRELLGRDVLLVAHGGVVRAILADALGMAPADIFRLDQSYAGVSVIEYVDTFPIVRALNVSPEWAARAGGGAQATAEDQSRS